MLKKVIGLSLGGVPIAVDASVFQNGQGTIVDSGTTDTFLPKAVATGFSEAWQASTGEVGQALHVKYQYIFGDMGRFTGRSTR